MDNSERCAAHPSTRDKTSIRSILFLVTYLFVGSLLALSGASSAWASSFDIDRTIYSVSRDRLTISCDAAHNSDLQLTRQAYALPGSVYPVSQ